MPYAFDEGFSSNLSIDHLVLVHFFNLKLGLFEIFVKINSIKKHSRNLCDDQPTVGVFILCIVKWVLNLFAMPETRGGCGPCSSQTRISPS